MSKHWYRNNLLCQNKLFEDGCIIPEGFSKESYSDYQSKIQFGENHPSYGKHLSKDTKDKISKSNKGKIVSKETRLKLSEKAKQRDYSNFHPNHKGINNPRYGIKYTMDYEKKQSFLEKRYKTMKENNTFNVSKPEEDYYNYLLTIYNENDIIRQYKDIRYPFCCDFYIKSKDLFIECNFSWTHGNKPFDKDDIECKKLLEKWKSKTNGKDYYSQAIYTWTDLDVRKQQIAKDNNLNIKFIYNNNQD